MLKATFARFGIPDQIVSDNGPQYTSEPGKTFADSMTSHITHLVHIIHRATDTQRGQFKLQNAFLNRKTLH